MIESIVKLIPDSFYNGIGKIIVAAMPLIVPWMWNLAKKQARLEYDLDNLGAKLGTEKGVSRMTPERLAKIEKRRLKENQKGEQK